jgi:hypothetical protein
VAWQPDHNLLLLFRLIVASCGCDVFLIPNVPPVAFVACCCSAKDPYRSFGGHDFMDLIGLAELATTCGVFVHPLVHFQYNTTFGMHLMTTAASDNETIAIKTGEKVLSVPIGGCCCAVELVPAEISVSLACVMIRRPLLSHSQTWCRRNIDNHRGCVFQRRVLELRSATGKTR